MTLKKYEENQECRFDENIIRIGDSAKRSLFRIIGQRMREGVCTGLTPAQRAIDFVTDDIIEKFGDKLKVATAEYDYDYLTKATAFLVDSLYIVSVPLVTAAFVPLAAVGAVGGAIVGLFKFS